MLEMGSVTLAVDRTAFDKYFADMRVVVDRWIVDRFEVTADMIAVGTLVVGTN